MNAGLVLLALRRALAPVVVLAWVVLLAVALRHDWAGGSAALEATAGDADAEGLARGLGRAGAWIVIVLAVVPLLVARAARVVPTWRAGEGDWIGSRSLGRAAVAASMMLGSWAGAAAILLATFASIELCAGPAIEPARAWLAIALPAARWIEPGAPLAVVLADPGERAPAGSRARVELAFAEASGSASEVVLRATRLGSGAESSRERSTSARLAGRGAVEVELPPGPGDVRLEIAAPRAGSRVLPSPGEIEIWAPCASDRSAGARILARLLAASLAWMGLALGLAAWMSAPSASLAVLAAWIAAWLGDATPAWLPGGDLWSALDTVGSGRVPAAPDPGAHAVALACAALGLALAILGTRRWRIAP